MRLFVAIDFLPHVKKELGQAIAYMQEEKVSGRYTRQENLHLTLQFLGKTSQQSAIEQALAQVSCSAFPLILSGIGDFSGRGGRTVWVGVEDSLPLQQLHHAVGAALEPLGFQQDTRPFRPHITLGRQVKYPPGCHKASVFAGVSPIAIQVEEITLMQSHYSQGQLTYTPLWRGRLKK